MESTSEQSYWTSVFLAAFLFGLVSFALTMGIGYYQINNGSAGGVGFSSITGSIVCLFTAFGGMLAVWHYLKEGPTGITIGRGAVIGLITGILIGIISFLLTKLWTLFDPSYASKLIDMRIAAATSNPNITDQQRQQISDAMHNGGGLLMIGYIIGIVFEGVVNLLTGMLGAKLFSKEEQQTT